MAVASAAAAIATAATLPPPAGFAAMAAMATAMVGLLSSVGIAFSGGSADSAGVAKEKHLEQFNSSGISGRSDLVSNSLVDGIDALVDVDANLFTGVRDLQIAVLKLNDTFDILGKSLYQQFGATGTVQRGIETKGSYNQNIDLHGGAGTLTGAAVGGSAALLTNAFLGGISGALIGGIGVALLDAFSDGAISD